MRFPHSTCRKAPGLDALSRIWDNRRSCWMVRILPGEFHVTASGEGLTTVLGSCVSACIRDPAMEVGGMNHFMLPEDTTSGKSAWLDAGAGLATRYGSFAMESLINGLLKLGARRERLEVKLFGGGRVLKAALDVGERNIEFARKWMRMEGFHVAAEDLGGDAPRRVIYMPTTGTASIRHLRSVDCQDVALREEQHLSSFVTRPISCDTELFHKDDA